MNQEAGAQPMPDEACRRTSSGPPTTSRRRKKNLERRREERENIRLTFEADIKRYQELRAIKPR